MKWMDDLKRTAATVVWIVRLVQFLFNNYPETLVEYHQFLMKNYPELIEAIRRS